MNGRSFPTIDLRVISRHGLKVGVTMKHLILSLLLLISSSISLAAITLPLNKAVLSNQEITFLSHRGEGRFETTLAMNVQYAPVKSLREELNLILGYKLNFFTLWQPTGEAHITVITPVEYFDKIKPYLSIERIEAIAQELNIQNSKFEILGLGRGQANLQSKNEETFFIIVNSENLLNIRKQIYAEYLKNGGPADAWDPDLFYPHITVGYSLRDLHIDDGVIKSVDKSLDKRFELTIFDTLD